MFYGDNTMPNYGSICLNLMSESHFRRIENYNLRLKPAGVRNIVNEFSNVPNKKVSFQGKESTWNLLSF
ncbi:MAG: CRISP-associated protein Cas1 [Euryarchaeota archaeon]|nr:CRISP-associated protein Cas1 [Euryarchaeota archaeon]